MKTYEQTLNREEIAKREIGQTRITPILARVLTAIFLATIFSVPLVQMVYERHQYQAGQRASPWPDSTAIFRSVTQIPTWWRESAGSFRARIFRVNARLLRDMHTYQDTLKDQSLLKQVVLPPAQWVLTRWLGVGNEKAYCGLNGWLFYRPEIDYLTGRGFLEPRVLAKRSESGSEWQAPPQPDPRRAIRQFHDQLAARGIALIIMPAPAKPSIQPEQFTLACQSDLRAIQNASYAALLAELRRDGLVIFDVADALARRRQESREPQYLATDTHWRPEAMQWVAEQLGAFIQTQLTLSVGQPVTYRSETGSLDNLGDTALMLNLPPWQTLYGREPVAIRRILTPGNAFWRASDTADILFLGDSFANIYSLEPMGWGESAGLVEQLSFIFQRPIDRIVRNDSGAYATRAALARDLAAGRDRLAGKKLVIWQFAARELTEGDWKLIDLKVGRPAPVSFFVPTPGTTLTAHGLIKSISAVPRPGLVPYKDHILSIHLVDLEFITAATADTNTVAASLRLASETSGTARRLQPIPEAQLRITNGQALVYMRSMQDNRLLAPARYQPGDIVRLRLQTWSDVAARYEGINRSEPENDTLQLQEPCWGEAFAQTAEIINAKTPRRQVNSSSAGEAMVGSDLATRFRKECTDLAQSALDRGTMTVTGRQDWLFLAGELRHIGAGLFWGDTAVKVSQAAKPEYADPLPAIVDFHDQLKKIGVELLVVPVPPKAIIYPDQLTDMITAAANSAPPRLDNSDQAFYELLRQNGIKVLDLTPVFLKFRFHPDGALYCRQDSHWSGNGCVLAARQIADAVRNADWFKSLPQQTFTQEWKTVEITGDLWRGLNDDARPKERVPLRTVGTFTPAGPQPVKSDPASPVILLGDSHNLIFHAGDDMQARGAGLPDQLALELGLPVDLVAVRGSGATPARINLLRRAQKDPHYWAGKKLVIWCFAAREFTESDGWRKVPLAPDK